MHDRGAAPQQALLQVRRRRRRGAEEVPPPRRRRGLRRAGAPGAGMEPALPADRRAGQLRLASTATRAAAYRYTEARLSGLAELLLADIDKETVDFGPNFDDSTKEPLVLPARFPNLLVNGSAGIAVGMATNIPPHNLGEVIESVIHLIDNPEGHRCRRAGGSCPGPDFPTAGIIIGTRRHPRGLRDRPGRSVRARAEIEVDPQGPSARPSSSPRSRTRSTRRARRADRRPGAGQEAGRHQRPARRVLARGHARRHRAEARRDRRRWC